MPKHGKLTQHEMRARLPPCPFDRRPPNEKKSSAGVLQPLQAHKCPAQCRTKGTTTPARVRGLLAATPLTRAGPSASQRTSMIARLVPHTPPPAKLCCSVLQHRFTVLSHRRLCRTRARHGMMSRPAATRAPSTCVLSRCRRAASRNPDVCACALYIPPPKVARAQNMPPAGRRARESAPHAHRTRLCEHATAGKPASKQCEGVHALHGSAWAMHMDGHGHGHGHEHGHGSPHQLWSESGCGRYGDAAAIQQI
eukprot:272806-Prymnesium_polylepis.1